MSGGLGHRYRSGYKVEVSTSLAWTENRMSEPSTLEPSLSGASIFGGLMSEALTPESLYIGNLEASNPWCQEAIPKALTSEASISEACRDLNA